MYQCMRWSGAMAVARKWLGERAVIIMLHDIQEDPVRELMTGTPAGLLEYILCWLRRHEFELVTLDECLRRLPIMDDARRCAALTFDDGYRDLMTVALPILERHHAPFMMYIPTGAITRTLPSWWLGLRELFRANDHVAIDTMGRVFSCRDYGGKVRAFDAVNRWIHQDYSRIAGILRNLESAGISLPYLNETYCLDEDELRILARHPLASVGGHTVSHAALATLNASEAAREIGENRDYLEQLTGSSVRHFAYPYGTEAAFGPRDQQLCQAAGFRSAVSAQPARISGEKADMYALPRICIGGPSGTRISFEGEISGVRSLVNRVSGGIGGRQRWSASAG
jgi:peptidoglycan/xylan/chitin deacetylase (PgdA/CDA1 family)